MAIEQPAFDILKSLAPRRALFLGYPDLLLSEPMDAPLAKDAESIARWHNWQGPVYDTDAVFGALGMDCTYIDIHASRGPELIYDLNETINWVAPKFDLVVDAGTVEHIFNIATAMFNVRKLCMVGGHMLHGNPISMTGHGFYNLSPTFYADWARHNGDTIVTALMLAGRVGAREVYEMPMTQRFSPPANATSLVLIKRSEAWGRGFPTQSKYLKNPGLKS